MQGLLKFSLLGIPLIFIFAHCSAQEQQLAEAPLPPTRLAKVIPREIPPPFHLEQHLQDYEKCRAAIPSFKAELKTRYPAQVDQIPAAKKLLTTILVDSIFTYWYGTTWDFNGHTDAPRNGDIACGYFVSTTLKHAGIKLNRYKIAQQASAVIVEKLCAPTSIQRLTSFEDLSNYVEQTEEDDILIIGLDYHVGFVVKRNDKHYFYHSDYAGRVGVKKEFLGASAAIRSSTAYVIGNVSTNLPLLKQWMTGI